MLTYTSIEFLLELVKSSTYPELDGVFENHGFSIALTHGENKNFIYLDLDYATFSCPYYKIRFNTITKEMDFFECHLEDHGYEDNISYTTLCERIKQYSENITDEEFILLLNLEIIKNL